MDLYQLIHMHTHSEKIRHTVIVSQYENPSTRYEDYGFKSDKEYKESGKKENGKTEKKAQ